MDCWLSIGHTRLLADRWWVKPNCCLIDCGLGTPDYWLTVDRPNPFDGWLITDCWLALVDRWLATKQNAAWLVDCWFLSVDCWLSIGCTCLLAPTVYRSHLLSRLMLIGWWLRLIGWNDLIGWLLMVTVDWLIVLNVRACGRLISGTPHRSLWSLDPVHVDGWSVLTRLVAPKCMVEQ